MAYTDYFDEVQSIYIAYYQRPADPAGLRYWAQRLNAEGGNLDAIIDAFSNSPEAKSLYTETDPLKLVDSVYQALFGRPADNGADNFYVKALEAGKFPDGRPATLGRVAIDVLNGAQGDDRVAIDNKLKVANDFTQIVDGRPLTDPEFGFDGLAVTYKGDADAAAAREFLKGVTSDPSTVPTQDGVKEVVAEKIADPTDAPVETGKTFMLTTGADNFTGTAGNDTFNGVNNSDPTTTLTAADVINGGAGIDSLNVTVTAGAAVLNGADIKNVEILNVRNVGSGAAAVDASQVVGLTEVNSDRSTGSLTVTNLATGATLGLKGNGVAALGNVTGSYVAAATAANIVVDGGTGAASSAVTVLNGAALTSATITSKGGVNALNGVAFGTGAGTADNVKTVTIDAQSNLTTGNITGLAAGSTITVKGAGTANIGTLLATNVTSVDASANTGGVTAVLNNVATLKVVGGSGNDVLTTGAVLTTGSVDGGAGTDTLVLGNVAHANTAALAAKYTNFEVLRLNGAFDASLIAGIEAIELSGANNNISKLSATQAGAVTALANIGATTLALATDTGTADVVSLTLGDGKGAAFDTGALTVNGVETLNIKANAKAGDADQTSVIASFTADKLTAINLTGSAVTLQNAATTKAVTIDASALTGDGSAAPAGPVGLTISGNVVTGSKVIGSGVNDTFNLGTGFATYNGGAGNDTFNATVAQLNTGADYNVIDGGAGTDTLNINNGTNTAVTIVDNNLSKVSGIERIVIATSGTANQSIQTGGWFDAAFKASGVDLTTTSTTGAISIDMTSFTGAATLTTTSTDGNQTIQTGTAGGNDKVTAVAGKGNVSVTTGAGDDTVSITNSDDVTGTNTVTTGAGNDTITLSVAASKTVATTITAGAGADVITLSTTGTSTDTIVIGNTDSGITVATADTIKNFLSGTDKLKMGTAADASTVGAINYHEAAAAVAGFDAALTAANTILAQLATNNTGDVEAYAFQWDATNGYLFNDTDGNGTADQVIILTGITGAGIAATDIIA